MRPITRASIPRKLKAGSQARLFVSTSKNCARASWKASAFGRVQTPRTTHTATNAPRGSSLSVAMSPLSAGGTAPTVSSAGSQPAFWSVPSLRLMSFIVSLRRAGVA